MSKLSVVRSRREAAVMVGDSRPPPRWCWVGLHLIDLHCTFSCTCASLRLMFSPLYGAVWHRYTPIMSRLTFLILKRPSGVSVTDLPPGISRSFSARDHSTGGRGLPSTTRHTSSVLPPSCTLTTCPPGGTDSTGGETEGNKWHRSTLLPPGLSKWTRFTLISLYNWFH